MIKFNQWLESTNSLLGLIHVFRKNLEDYYDWHDDKMCMKGVCQSVTKELVEFLKQKGYVAKRVGGYYYDLDDEFQPNMDNWDVGDISRHNNEIKSHGKMVKSPHWWVEVDNKWIDPCDVTADQFHPGMEDEYRVVLINKKGQDTYRKV